jgi:hypothetical protein
MESDQSKALKSIKKYYSDEAFKKNDTVIFHELKIVKVEPVSYLEVINWQKEAALNMYESYLSMSKNNTSLIELQTSQFKLYKSMFGNDIVTDIKKEDVQRTLKEGKAILDTAKYYGKALDSLEKIKVDTSLKNYYLIKAYVKASFKDENLLDTSLYLADKDFRIINPKTAILLNR